MKNGFSLGLFFVTSALLLCTSAVYSQQKQWAEAKARTELEARGISEEELRNKLAEKGINLDQLSNLSAEQALQMQKDIENAIQEIEAEKKVHTSSPQIPSALDSPMKKLNGSNAAIATPSKTKENNSSQDTGKITHASSSSIPSVTWGQHIFKNKSIDVYRSGSDIKAPSGYILGVGDKLSISIWGLSQLNESYEIQQDGYIVPARMPRIFVKGLSLGRAKSMLSGFFQKFYRFEKNQFDVSLIQSRTINVNVFGEVLQPGGYNLPAVNTAFNALMAAGGPTEIGSVRKIKLIRDGKSRMVDVYKWMQNPSPDKDMYLEDNDILQVPVAEKWVLIQGAVNRPFQYELLENENLNQLISYAGGLKENAITKTIQIERILNDKRTIIDIAYDEIRSKKADVLLHRGDRVTVFSLRTQAEEFVHVSGEVRVEAMYQCAPGMKLSELIGKIEFTPESNLQIAFVKRRNADQNYSLIRVNLRDIQSGNKEADLELRGGDELMVYKQAAYTDAAYVNIRGAVRHEGRFNLNPKGDIRVKDLLLLAGGLRSDAFDHALLYRTKLNNQKDYEVLRISVRDIMDDGVAGQNIFLQPYDSLIVLSQSNFEEAPFVEISGAVKLPGRYAYGKGISVRDVITLANGFTYFAATNRIDIFRVMIKDNEPIKTIVKSITTRLNLEEASKDATFELEPYDIIVVRGLPEFRMQQLVQIEGEVKYPGPYALVHPNERLSDLIQRAGGFTAEAFPSGASLYRSKDSIGYIVISLDQVMQNTASRSNIILSEGDYLFIPKQKDLVRIAGATNVHDLYPEKVVSGNNAISVAFEGNRSAKYYIDRFAAGVSKNGDLDKVTVEHPNGKIDRTKHFLFFKIYPKVSKGSVVNVGYKEIKPEAQKKERKDVDWAKVVADSIAQATAILSLILLIDRLN